MWEIQSLDVLLVLSNEHQGISFNRTGKQQVIKCLKVSRTQSMWNISLSTLVFHYRMTNEGKTSAIGIIKPQADLVNIILAGKGHARKDCREKERRIL